MRENLEYRNGIIDGLKSNPHLIPYMFEKCKRDILFFFNCRLWTYDPRRQEMNHLPFITYSFQDNYILDIYLCVIEGKDNITEKSRDMGYSWMMLGIITWGFLFHGWSSLIGSYKEDYVDQQGNMDSSFERIRYMIDRLPSWMKPNDMVSKFMNISSVELGGVAISGDAGQYFGTGGRRKLVWMDEFSMRQYADTAFRKTKDLTLCRCMGGTPEGSFNVYGKIMTNHKDYKHLNIKKFRLHRSQHPLKTADWYNIQKKQRTRIDLAKEIDISYEASVTGAVYPHYRQLVRSGHFPFNPYLKTYTGRDFGLDTNALVIFQIDFRTMNIYVIASISRIDRDIRKFAAFVTGRPTPNFTYEQEEIDFIENASYRSRTYANHFGDPYNADNRSTINVNSTIRTTLQEMGIYLTTKRDSTVEERIKKVTLTLGRFHVDESNSELNQSMIQCHYPQIKEGSQNTSENTKPVHDVTSHFRTAVEYFVDNIPDSDEYSLESSDVEVDYGNNL